MARKPTACEIEERLASVRLTLQRADWIRPIEAAHRTGLSLHKVVNTLRMLESTHEVTRRVSYRPAIRGKARPRKTSSPIVEYRLNPSTSPVFAVMCPVIPVAIMNNPHARRVVGRASAL